MPEKRPGRPQQTLLGSGVLLIGILLAVGATGIRSEAGYSGVGPNFFPWAVAAALVLCGAGLLWEAGSGGFRAMEPPSGATRGDIGAVAWVAAGVAANAALITSIGFILSCTLCFMLAVRGLRESEGKGHGGAKGMARDFVTGFLIAGPAFWLFTKVLGINLPGLSATGWI